MISELPEYIFRLSFLDLVLLLSTKALRDEWLLLGACRLPTSFRFIFQGDSADPALESKQGCRLYSIVPGWTLVVWRGEPELVLNRHVWALIASVFAKETEQKDMAAPAQLIDYVAAERLTTLFDVAAAMLLVYDCSLTLGMEIEFVWSSPWGYMTVLYIVQRYLPFCDAIFLCLPPQLAINIDPYGCLIVQTIRGWMMIFGWILSEAILTLRVWAVWKRDRHMGVFLIFLITLSV
ncbi:uncharacterized protein LACBIDRAFT_336272 [Laccaria bicolor S238N-H82]|uniref:Predicted protein n=1 Tax=Laccaria bicolor (strain S238N-H82 / ATCC MYA-4686) TaxID=486041 RepID=B0E4Y4_LACBS|nr:uncharacterized protein LACBIDRAFT_336272 [Laccaria bicolor S238N-H82]EDQ98097.1 predicted protein [Laccaria bicolor S238N-H82]|eukprot:XP_001891252.1 predicted protein [Laccaria bicolor S238N-H82]